MNQFEAYEDYGVLNLRQCCVLIEKLSNSELRKYNVKISETEEGKKPAKYSYHPGLDEYIIEFEKYLCNLHDPGKGKEGLQELEEKNIEKDLVIQMESGEHKTNKKLVEWIIGNQPDKCRLELNWNLIDQAVRVLKYQELKNKSNIFYLQYPELETFKTASQDIDGLQVPSMFSVDLFRSAMKYEARPDDIFVAAYPKCGATWVQHILLLIFRQGQPIESIMSFMLETPYIDLVGAKGAEIMTRPGAIKTHLPYNFAPISDEAKYIYVARHFKDCCLSYFHYMRGTPGHGFNGNFDKFYDLFIRGRIDYGNYLDHLLGWYEHRNDPNVLFLTYEEIQENPESTVLKMASFLDEVKFAKPLKDDPEKLSNVLKYSSFEHMKQFFKEGIDQMSSFSKEDLLKSDFSDEIKESSEIFLEMVRDSVYKWKDTVSPLVRKAITGDWKNYFSFRQADLMTYKFEEKFRGTELEKIWFKYIV